MSGETRLVEYAGVAGRLASARAAIERGAGEARPEGMAGVAFVRYEARTAAAVVHADLTPAEWDAISAFPDTMAHLTGRLTAALGLDDPEGAEWELTYVQEGASLE